MTSSRQCSTAHLPLRWRALVVLCFCCLASPAFAVTLGQETILSLLGDPIEVEINVLQWDDIDLERVQITLASPAEYESFSLNWLPILEQLDFNLVGPNSRGEVKVLVSTREPMSEPYVELLLVMRWPGGSLLREYVLLFDLPQTRDSDAVVAVVTAPAQPGTFESDDAPPLVRRVETVASAGTEDIPEPVPDPPQLQAAEPESAAPVFTPDPVLAPDADDDVPQPRTQGAILVDTAVPSAQPEPPATGRRVYQVREGDGLWSIAQQFQPAGVGENIYQMLLSLHDLNRAAFINGNISLLKANALLQIPDADDIESVAAATAEKRFEQRWDEGTVRLQTALRGDPLPEFSDLYAEGNIEAGPQAALESRTPGTETGRVTPGGSGLLLPATTPVVVPVSDTPVAPDDGDLLLGEPGVQQVAVAAPGAQGISSQAGTAAQESALQSATINPYLERINSSTRELQALLQNRSLQIASLETQLVEMRQRMRDAQQVTARLNEALEQALAQRGAQQSAASRNTTVLGVVALVLLVAVLAAMVMLLKLTAQLRSQRQLLDEHDDFPDPLETALPLDTPRSEGRRAAAFAGQETGIIVEEAGMSAGSDDEGLQQELLEIIGPAMEDDPDSQSSGRNRA